MIRPRFGQLLDRLLRSFDHLGMDRHRARRQPVQRLPKSLRSLAEGPPPSLPTPPGTLFLLGASGGIMAEPQIGLSVCFGRSPDDADVCVGANDGCISRRHGHLTRYGDEWWIRNEGQIPIRIPVHPLLLSGKEAAIQPGYTPLFLKTAARREHLLEVLIVGAFYAKPMASPYDGTTRPRTWPLDAAERLVLTALARNYLEHDNYPQPQSWRQVADDLNELPGEDGWTDKRAAGAVKDVRDRLSAAGIRGLQQDEVGGPVGNTINHNLIQELLITTTLTPPDLRLLGIEDD